MEKSAQKDGSIILQFQGRKSNSFTGSAMQYSDSKSVAPGRITGFSIRSQINDVIVWDISDPLNTKQIQYTKTEKILLSKLKLIHSKHLLLLPANAVLTPSIETYPVPNQNLHASEPADMIIVTHPLFKSYAEKLADIHLEQCGLISQVVTPEQIYNEFSGGIPDIAPSEILSG